MAEEAKEAKEEALLGAYSEENLCLRRHSERDEQMSLRLRRMLRRRDSACRRRHFRHRHRRPLWLRWPRRRLRREFL